MSVHAYLETEASCPYCGAIVPGRPDGWSFVIQFSWGYTEYIKPLPENTYHIGDSIRWRPCPDGRVIPWSYFDSRYGYNFGSPLIQHLVVTDLEEEWGWLGYSCPHCDAVLGGGAIEIKEGIIVRGWLYREGEFSEEHFYYRPIDGGLYEPVPEWETHDYTVLDENCNEL